MKVIFTDRKEKNQLGFVELVPKITKRENKKKAFYEREERGTTAINLEDL